MSDIQLRVPEAAPSPDQASSESRLAKGKRTGLIWMNGILLLLYGYGSGALVVQGNYSHGISGIMWAVILVGSVLVAGCLFGFLAALTPKCELTRKLAKCANLLVIGMAVLTSLRNVAAIGSHTGFSGSSLIYGLFLSALISTPALVNLRAFWRRSTGVPPPLPDK